VLRKGRMIYWIDEDYILIYDANYDGNYDGNIT
jgi:hypothetical protein